MIVVCDPPIGPGNVRNLELTLDAGIRGIPVVVLDAMPIAERDFTGGRATELWARLRDLGESVGSYPDAVTAILSHARVR